jgi:hypothetical protein
MAASNSCVGQGVSKAKRHASRIITYVRPPELDREALCAQTLNDDSVNDPEERLCATRDCKWSDVFSCGRAHQC